ncbi:MAG: glycosyltransferase family 4 protein [Lautropia sp.]
MHPSKEPPSGSRLIFVNRFYYPDISATSQILTDLCVRLARRGYRVEVVTSRSRYDDAAAGLPASEIVDGVLIRRVATTRFGRATTMGRLVDYVSFYLSSIVALWRTVRRGDVIVAKTDPPLLSVPCMLVAQLRGAHAINWFQDVFPEVAMAAGIGRRFGPAGRLLMATCRWGRDLSIRRADANVVVGERMRRLLETRGSPSSKLATIPNWVDLTQIRPIAHDHNALRSQWGLEKAFVIGYSGNMGVAHDFNAILEAAQLLLGRPSIQFLLIGGGKQRQWLEAEIVRRGLANIRLRPYQPREQLSLSLSAADVHLVSLRPSMEGLVVPSKFYGICAAARPTLFLGDPDGELGVVIRREQCGICVPDGNGTELARAITMLADEPALATRLGSAARRLVDQDHGGEEAAERWDRVLTDVLRRS